MGQEHRREVWKLLGIQTLPHVMTPQYAAYSISTRIAGQIDEVLDTYRLRAHTLSALFIAIGSSALGSSKSLQSSN